MVQPFLIWISLVCIFYLHLFFRICQRMHQSHLVVVQWFVSQSTGECVVDRTFHGMHANLRFFFINFLFKCANLWIIFNMLKSHCIFCAIWWDCTYFLCTFFGIWTSRSGAVHLVCKHREVREGVTWCDSGKGFSGLYVHIKRKYYSGNVMNWMFEIKGSQPSRSCCMSTYYKFYI